MNSPFSFYEVKKAAKVGFLSPFIGFVINALMSALNSINQQIGYYCNIITVFTTIVAFISFLSDYEELKKYGLIWLLAYVFGFVLLYTPDKLWVAPPVDLIIVVVYVYLSYKGHLDEC